MNRIIYVRRLSYLLIILLFSCKQDEIKRTYPVLTTDEVSDISPQGANFSATFTNATPDDILDCGFVWGASERLDLASNLFIKLPKPSGSNFSTAITSNLLVSTRYFVRPFVRTKDIVVYGKPVSFISLGSAAPVILDFNPKKARTGDTLVFKGNNFGQNIKQARLVFESTTNQTSVTAPIAKISENEVKVVVPLDLIEKTTLPRLEVLGNSTRAAANFELTLPEILTLANPVVRFCDSISASINTNGYNITRVEINGSSAGFKVSGQTIKMALSIPANPLSIRLFSGKVSTEKSFPISIDTPSLQPGYATSILSSDTITLKLKYPLNGCGFQFRYVMGPTGLPTPKLIILNQTTQEVTFTFSQDYCPSSPLTFEFYNSDTKLLSVTDINLKKPEIISISPTQVNAGDEITLSVKNIAPTTKFSGLNIESSALVTQISKNQIKAIVPTDLAFTWQGQIASKGFIPITVFSCYIASDVNLTVEPKTPIITGISPSMISTTNQIVTVNGDNFSPIPSLNLITVPVGYPTILSASRTQLTFSSIEALPYNHSQTATVPITVTTLGKKVSSTLSIDYHGLWTDIAVPSADNRVESFQFTINGKGYFGGGSLNGTFYKDVWEYDPNTNHWTRMADFPGTAIGGYVFFSTGTKAYVGMGLGPGPSFTPANDWWEFDPTLNKWTAKTSYPGTGRYYHTIFTINGIGYMGGGRDLNYVFHRDFWAYDSNSDTWIPKADIPALVLNAENPPSFGFKGLGYTLITALLPATSSIEQRLHIYDPTNNSWSTNSQHQSSPEMPSEIPLIFSDFVIVGDIKFDPVTDQRTRFSFYDGNRTFRCRFSIGNAGYFGLGFDLRTNGSLNDFFWLDTTKF